MSTTNSRSTHPEDLLPAQLRADAWTVDLAGLPSIAGHLHEAADRLERSRRSPWEWLRSWRSRRCAEALTGAAAEIERLRGVMHDAVIVFREASDPERASRMLWTALVGEAQP